MKKCVAVRHVAFENLGSWVDVINKNYEIDYVDAADPAISSLDNQLIDLLIILGGPIGAYQEAEYPFIHTELALLSERLKDDLPTVGICLGSQLMARALGARVYPNQTTEIGWHPLSLTEKGKSSCVNHLSEEHTSMFHWHGDTFDLPNGADLLASTPSCRHQIFRWKNNCLGFQCHPEITAQLLEHWWIGHAHELSTSEISVSDLRDDSYKLDSRLEKQGHLFLKEWLEQISPI